MKSSALKTILPAFLVLFVWGVGVCRAGQHTTLPSVGDIWSSGETTETYSSSYLGAATGCMKLRGLEDNNLVKGYSVNGLTNAKTYQGQFNFPKDENRRFDFKGYFQLKVSSGRVRVMEVSGSGGGCPDRLGLR